MLERRRPDDRGPRPLQGAIVVMCRQTLAGYAARHPGW